MADNKKNDDHPLSPAQIKDVMEYFNFKHFHFPRDFQKKVVKYLLYIFQEINKFKQIAFPRDYLPVFVDYIETRLLEQALATKDLSRFATFSLQKDLADILESIKVRGKKSKYNEFIVEKYGFFKDDIFPALKYGLDFHKQQEAQNKKQRRASTGRLLSKEKKLSDQYANFLKGTIKAGLGEGDLPMITFDIAKNAFKALAGATEEQKNVLNWNFLSIITNLKQVIKKSRVVNIKFTFVMNRALFKITDTYEVNSDSLGLDIIIKSNEILTRKLNS